MLDPGNTTNPRKALAVAGLLLCAACSNLDVTRDAAPSDSARPTTGYIVKADYLEASALLPQPPAENSAAQALDDHLSEQYLQLMDTPRWEQATADAKIRYPNHAAAFSCAAGVSLTASTTPVTNNVLFRAMFDVATTVRPVKSLYQRPRPFMVNREPVCTPTGVRHLERDGSYPSGHSATGWIWGLILAEIVPPEAVDKVLARGWAFGESRAVCNVHWQSDVMAGRTIGTFVVAQLHGIEEFRSDLDAARTEIAAALADSNIPDPDCAAEADGNTD